MTEIRTMSASDIEAAIELWQNTKGLGIGLIDTVEKLSSHLERNPTHNFVAFNSNRLVGAVLGGFDGRRGYIYHLAVDENYRRNNIGQELMEKCFESFKAIDIEKCHMMVFKSNVSAIQFYESIGCRLRDDVVMFTKDLVLPST